MGRFGTFAPLRPIRGLEVSGSAQGIEDHALRGGKSIGVDPANKKSDFFRSS